MRSALTAATAALLLLVLAGCAAERSAGGAATARPDLIVVRAFAFSPDSVTLDPSLGFSLRRGEPGVPRRERAASVGRAATFSLADAIAQRLGEAGYAVMRADSNAPVAARRALIVTGTVEHIDEGHRRQNAGIAVNAEIDLATSGAAPRRIMAFPVDSRRLPPGYDSAAARHEVGVNAAASRVGDAIAGTVVELARRNRWPAAR